MPTIRLIATRGAVIYSGQLRCSWQERVEGNGVETRPICPDCRAVIDPVWQRGGFTPGGLCPDCQKRAGALFYEQWMQALPGQDQSGEH